MGESALQKIHLDGLAYGRWVADRYEIWPDEFMELDKFGSWASEKATRIGGFPYHGLRLLWRLGFIKADIILSERPLDFDGLTELGSESGRRIIADTRSLPHRPQGWTGCASTPPEVPRDTRLLFHRFKLFTLRQIEEFSALRASAIQMLLNADGFSKIVEFNVEAYNHWTSQPEFSDWIDYYNAVPMLAAAIEPCVQDAIYGRFKAPWRMEKQRYWDLIDQHWADVSPVISAVGPKNVEKLLSEIAFDRDGIDPHRDLQTFLRLCGKEVWDSLKGSLGAAFTYRLMGEVLRRGAEKALAMEFREEDEVGRGYMLPGVKAELYGAERLLEADRRVRADFVRKNFVDFRVAARWYVEGDTEAAFIEELFGGAARRGVVVANLCGRVREKGVAFADSLRADEANGVFSFILLDGDCSLYVKTVKEEAAADTFCGWFFLSEPDFEFANFSIDELAEAIWGMVLAQAETRGDSLPTESVRIGLREAVAETKSGKELEHAAAKYLFPLGFRFSKGSAWGAALARLVGQGIDRYQSRPIVEAIRIVARSAGASFSRMRLNYVVDPDSGQLRERNQPKS